ncbi:hypothetical protein BQ8794_270021 [Mesorhizobium prunaredense]|uniref:Uncharacterized protein n=1 Tax=Mesorhizobium prunaredense TaxID=1631249 RepID=A0A1R3V8N7_9HYPH|nr:hypothetical protein BQ8794_270021 [Mesorhizobium prunaredense]
MQVGFSEPVRPWRPTTGGHGMSSFVSNKSHLRRHDYQRATDAPPCNNNSSTGGPSKQVTDSNAIKGFSQHQGEGPTPLHDLKNTPRTAQARQCQIILPKFTQTTQISPSWAG